VSYIDRTLLGGEHIVFRTRLHWSMLVGPMFLLMVVALPLTIWIASGAWRAYAWIPAALGVLAVLPALARRQSSEFAVTNKRVLFKVGVLDTRSVELLLGKIEAISVDQSLLGRMLGYGDIVVTGSGGTHEGFTRIQAPLEFRRAVQSVSDPGEPGTKQKD
jgi:uncharacterized membrane protein YdbT with pleckstrin-like domain